MIFGTDIQQKLYNALAVLVLNPTTRAAIQELDPQAWRQTMAAMVAANPDEKFRQVFDLALTIDSTHELARDAEWWRSDEGANAQLRMRVVQDAQNGR